MKLGCLINLVLFGGLIALYHRFLGRTLDPPPVWVVSGIMALLATLCLGAIYNAWLQRADAAALRQARAGFTPREGELAAVAGTLEPIRQPILSPLSGEPCVLYEFEIVRMVETRNGKNGSTSTSRVVDFAGIGLIPCRIVSENTSLPLMGFPDLNDFASRRIDDRSRARRLVQEAEWQDCTGVGIFAGAGSMWRALTEADEEFQHYWRMISPANCDWLPQADAVPTLSDSDPEEPDSQYRETSDDDLGLVDSTGDSSAESESDGDWLSDGSSYLPTLQEKRLAPGTAVVAIGEYDGRRGGLVSSIDGSGQMIRLYRGDLDQAIRRVGGSRRRYTIGGLIGLIVIHGVLWGGVELYRRNGDTQQTWRRQMVEALHEGRADAVQKLLDRGLDPRTADDHGVTLLMEARDPDTAQRLLAAGADVNAADEEGDTALMEAARQDRPELLQVLIDAGADLDVRNRHYNTTALMDAINAENPACIDLLRKAGAHDDTVDAESGTPIDVDHGAFQTCKDYLAGIHSADGARLRSLSTADRPATFDDVDWNLWHNSRPADPELLGGFVRGQDATLTIGGATPGGFFTIWVFQLRHEDAGWRIARERWVTKHEIR